MSSRGELYLKRGWVVPIIESGKRRGRLAEIANGLRMNARGRFGFGGGLSPRGALLAALAHGDRDGVKVAASILRTMTMRYGAVTDVFAPVLGYEPPAAWLSLFEPQERAAYLKEIVPRAFGQAIRLGDDVRAISLAEGDSEIRATVAMVLALAGESGAARAALESEADNAQWIRGARAFVALTQARHDEARALFAEAAVGSRKQRVELPGVLAPFDVLLAVTSDNSEEVADVDRRMTKGRRNFAEYFWASRALEAVEVYRRSGAKRPSPRCPLRVAELDRRALRGARGSVDGRRAGRAKPARDDRERRARRRLRVASSDTGASDSQRASGIAPRSLR